MARILSPFIVFYLFLKEMRMPEKWILRGTFRAVLIDSIVAQTPQFVKGGRRKAQSPTKQKTTAGTKVPAV
jgi:hypothetical protein